MLNTLTLRDLYCNTKITKLTIYKVLQKKAKQQVKYTNKLQCNVYCNKRLGFATGDVVEVADLATVAVGSGKPRFHTRSVQLTHGASTSAWCYQLLLTDALVTYATKPTAYATHTYINFELLG